MVSQTKSKSSLVRSNSEPLLTSRGIVRLCPTISCEIEFDIEYYLPKCENRDDIETKIQIIARSYGFDVKEQHWYTGEARSRIVFRGPVSRADDYLTWLPILINVSCGDKLRDVSRIDMSVIQDYRIELD